MSPKDRVSVANLAVQIRNRETGEVRYPTILNDGALRKKKEYLLAPPGGAAFVLKEGERQLLALGAEFTSDAEKDGRDARFLIEESALDAALAIVESADPALIEVSVDRELREEFCDIEMPEIQTEPVLQRIDFAEISTRYLGLYRQPLPEDGVGSSSNAQAGVRSRRSFFLHEMVVSNTVWKRLEACFPIVVLLTAEEVATTNGGRRKGKTERNGITFGIADNVILPPG